MHLTGHDEPLLGHAHGGAQAPPVLQHVGRLVAHRETEVERRERRRGDAT